MGEENFFKEKVFPPPSPHLSKTLNGGVFFYFHTPADRWYREICYKFRRTKPDSWLSALPTFFKEKVLLPQAPTWKFFAKGGRNFLKRKLSSPHTP